MTLRRYNMKIIRNVLRTAYGDSVDLMTDDIIENIAATVVTKYFENQSTVVVSGTVKTNSISAKGSVVAKKVAPSFDGVLKNASKKFQANGTYRVEGLISKSIRKNVSDGQLVNTNTIEHEEVDGSDLIVYTKDSKYRVEGGYVKVTSNSKGTIYVFNEKIYNGVVGDFIAAKDLDKFVINKVSGLVHVNVAPENAKFINESRAMLYANYVVKNGLTVKDKGK